MHGYQLTDPSELIFGVFMACKFSCCTYSSLRAVYGLDRTCVVERHEAASCLDATWINDPDCSKPRLSQVASRRLTAKATMVGTRFPSSRRGEANNDRLTLARHDSLLSLAFDRTPTAEVHTPPSD